MFGFQKQKGVYLNKSFYFEKLRVSYFENMKEPLYGYPRSSFSLRVFGKSSVFFRKSFVFSVVFTSFDSFISECSI